MATIDGVIHDPKGVVSSSKGSGDSEQKFEFRVLKSANRGPERWLLTDKGKWWLFQPPPDQNVPYVVAKEHERFEADRVTGASAARGATVYRWVRLEQPYTEIDPPFRGTSEALIVSGGGAPPRILLSLPLMVGSRDVFYTPSFPAAELPRASIMAKAGLGGGKLVPHLSLLLAVFFGAAAFLGVSAPIRALWWLGPLAIGGRFLATRQSLWDHCLRLLAGAFFLDFTTRGLDNVMTSEWEEGMAPLFESAKVAVIGLLLWVLRLASPRLFFSVIDGVNITGGCSWVVFACGVAVVTLVEEFNYFRFFDWYAGELPWSVLWFLGALLGIWHKFKDYRKVPLDRRGFRSLLYRTADTLEQGLPLCVSKALALSEWADDLEDALLISADPLVVSLADYAPAFIAWRDQVKNLQDVAPAQIDAETRQHLEADLAIVAADFRELVGCLDRWPESRQELRGLRRSPLLETWND